MKPEFEENAKALFEGTNIHITTGGTRHLGAAIGSKESRNDFVVKKVNAKKLLTSAKSFPGAKVHAVSTYNYIDTTNKHLYIGSKIIIQSLVIVNHNNVLWG